MPEPPGQPHHFQIAASLTLQPPARLDPVEIAVDVKLEHRRRMIGRPAGRCRIDTVKPEVAEFQRIDEHIDRPNRIALVDPILKAFRQQRRLPAIQSRHKAWHQIPRRFSRGSWHKKSFHTAWTHSVLSFGNRSGIPFRTQLVIWTMLHQTKPSACMPRKRLTVASEGSCQ